MPSINTIRNVGGGGIASIGGGVLVEVEYLGATMTFAQSAAPFGWTKLTTNNDCALRITSGSVTTDSLSPTSGSVDASSIFRTITPYPPGGAPVTINPHTTTTSEIPAHMHTVNGPFGSISGRMGSTVNNVFYFVGGATTTPNGTTGGAFTSPTTPVTGSSHNHSGSMNINVTSSFNFSVKYMDVILAKYH
jgi:hypothetical protein